MANLGGIIEAAASADSGRTALIVEDKSCSYEELHQQTLRWVGALHAAGVGIDDHVALAEWGGVKGTAVTLAAAHLGAATAQMNPLLTEGELSELVAAAACCRVGIATADAADALEVALGLSGRILRDAGRARRTLPPPVADDSLAALVLFTSGTTGVPKPVEVTHAALIARFAAYRSPFDAGRPANVSLMCVPSFHVGGMLGLLLSLYSGDTTVVQPRFDAGRWLAAVARHRVTSAFLVPTMLARILDHPDLAATDTSSLRVVSYGAAAAPTALIQRAMAAWPEARFANVFGQTETLGAYTSLSPVDHHDPARVGSVGRPLAGVEVRIVDAGTAEPVEPGEVGELWVRTRQAVGPVRDDGWLVTGDLARQDADGYLFPAGRRSDTINRGGEKFGPVEVAELLRAHPAVADVVVVGVPDDELGERVGAAVVLQPGAAKFGVAAARDWCAPRLARFKLPEVVVFVDALPYNELGKIPRAAAVELIQAHRTSE